MKKIKTTILLCAILFVYAGCQKGDKGDTGPAGTSGTANVQTLLYYNQVWGNSASDIYLTIPEITKAIFDKGAVIVYMKQSGTGTEWNSLPTLNFEVIIGQGYIDVFNNYGAAITVDLKVVLIPGS